MNRIKFLDCGECAVTIKFSDEINEETNRIIRFTAAEITKKNLKGIKECVPAFCSLTVYYDPMIISKNKLAKKIRKISDTYSPVHDFAKRVFYIPVCYDDDYAPDMVDVCKHTGLSRDEVIKIHTSTKYLIYMLGFLPGFPYLGGMDERLETPRLDTPRTLIPEGAVGIGGKQTGIYPVASPGGWRLIGETPVKIYNPDNDIPIAYRAGDYIKFFPINKDEYTKIKNDISYTIDVREEY